MTTISSGRCEAIPAPTSHSKAAGRTPGFASLVLIYNCALIWASVVFMTGGERYFTYAHVFFLASSAFVLLTMRGGLEGLYRPLVEKELAAWALAGFLAYYLTMALLYPDPEVSSYHLRSIAVRVLPGFLMGYMAFAAISSWRCSSAPTEEISTWRRYLDFVSLAIYAGTLAGVAMILVPIIRSDIFLIRVSPDRAMYQLLGVYVATAMIAAYIVLLDNGQFERRNSSTSTGVLQMASITSIALASFFLCQMAGSNMGAGLIALIGAVTGIMLIWRAWRVRALRQMASMMVVGIIAVSLFSAIVATVPPLRIFGFQSIVQSVSAPLEASGLGLVSRAESRVASFGPDIPSSSVGAASGRNIPAHPEDENSGLTIFIPSSVTSRVAIFEDIGRTHLGYAPLMGNLGVEHLFDRPGGYLHSILSVQSHLGIIGSILIFSFIFVKLYNLYVHSNNRTLKILVIPLIFMSFIGAFFTWTLLWFLIGIIYTDTNNDLN